MQERAPSVGIAASLAWAVLVALVFALLSAWVDGPAYLRDEIGYLNNAAFLAGRHAGGASSYYAGYPLLLAPLFYFLDHPLAVWRGVMIVNAVLWGGTLGLLHATVRRLFPGEPPRRLLWVMLLVAAYPANAVMSSYAFSQSAVAFVFAAAVASLFAVDMARPRTLVANAACVGLLSWIHPIGLVLPLAAWLALWPAARAARDYRGLALHVLISVALILAYRIGVDPWRIASMTPAGATAGTHYPGLATVIGALLSPAAWITPIASLFGQLAYSAVASFGLSVLAAISIVQLQGRQLPAAGQGAIDTRVAVRWFLLLAPLACMAATALSTASGTPTRLDHWLYGRYQDALILPLLGYGLLGARRRGTALWIAAAVALVGMWLSFGLDASGSPNRVNLSGLWPEPWMQDGSIALWLAWGAAGIIAFHGLPRRLAWTAALLLYAASIASQGQWHRMLLDTHSRPSDVVDFVRGNFPDACLYFDTASIPEGESIYSPRYERSFLYSYYFFDKRYDSGAQPRRWLREGCSHVLLSYASDGVPGSGLHVAGKERAGDLRIWVRQDPATLRYPKRETATSDWFPWTRPACLRSRECLHYPAAQLARFSQVGQLRDGAMATQGQAGFLFFGPYRPLPPGRYELSLRGTASASSSAYVDVVAQGARQTLIKQAIPARADGSLGTWHFEAPAGITDVQVRLWVGQGDTLAVRDYTLVQLEMTGGASPE